MPARLTFETMLQTLHHVLDQLPEHRKGKNLTYTLKDAALGAFAVLFMQSPSFLAHPQTMHRTKGRNNAQSTFGVERIPFHIQIRNLSDPITPEQLFPMFGAIWQSLEAEGMLTRFSAVNQTRLIAEEGGSGPWSLSVSWPIKSIHTDYLAEVRVFFLSDPPTQQAVARGYIYSDGQ